MHILLLYHLHKHLFRGVHRGHLRLRIDCKALVFGHFSSHDLWRVHIKVLVVDVERVHFYSLDAGVVSLVILIVTQRSDGFRTLACCPS